MGFLGGLSKVVRGATSSVLTAGRAVNKVPVVGTALRAVPGVGTALTLASAGASLSSAFGGRGGGAMPALPGGVPALPGAGAPGIVGDRSIFRNDPNVVAALQPWAIAKGNLRVSYRSPLKGYVIRYDSAGDPFAIPKTLARQYLGWRPAKKPPISVGDWQSIKRADRTVKKMKKIVAMTTTVDRNTRNGKVVIRRKKKKEA